MRNNRKHWRYSAAKAGRSRLRWDEWRKKQWGYIRQYRNYNTARSANGYPPATTKSESEPEFQPTPLYRVMTVWNEHFTATSLWKRLSNVETCVRADPVVNWMIGSAYKEATGRLIQLGFQWESSELMEERQLPLNQLQAESQDATLSKTPKTAKTHPAYKLPGYVVKQAVA